MELITNNLLLELVLVLLSSLDHINVISRQNKGASLSFHSELGLEVTQNVSEINVEQLGVQIKSYINVEKNIATRT